MPPDLACAFPIGLDEGLADSERFPESEVVRA